MASSVLLIDLLGLSSKQSLMTRLDMLMSVWVCVIDISEEAGGSNQRKRRGNPEVCRRAICGCR